MSKPWLGVKPLAAKPAKPARPSEASLAMLLVLTRSPKHWYEGTVPAPVIAKRRAANKAARMSRRQNRG